jgi:hypothetical protein
MHYPLLASFNANANIVRHALLIKVDSRSPRSVFVAVGHDMSAMESAKQIDGVSVDGYSGAAPPFRQRTLTVPPVKPCFLNFLHLREAAFVEKEEFSNRGCFKIGNCILLRNEKWVSQRGQ